MENLMDLEQQSVLIDSEKTVLAVAMYSDKARFNILHQLTRTDFSRDAHGIIFDAIKKLNENSQTISITQLTDFLEGTKELNKIGGVDYLSDISSYYYTDEGFEDYVSIIFKNSIGRQLDQALINIKQMRETKQKSIEEIFLEAQEKILNIRTELVDDEMSRISTIVDDVVEKIAALEENGEIINGVTSGFTDIDSITNGWQKGDFIILAARPSMGKTAFALNLAVNAAEKGKGVAFFSLEMPKEQLVQRILSSNSGVDGASLRNARGLDKDKWSKITSAAQSIKKMDIVIDDSPGINVLQIQSKLRKMKRDLRIDICFIDYLQLISSISNKAESRQNEVASISRYLKKIARELKIPIICLSQLSRSVEKREEKIPLMSDLRDSGAIEQDADIIMFLYREAYYKTKEYEVSSKDDIDETDVIISKHRNGATGVVKVNFMRNFGRFIDQTKIS
ncbi:replicative DNA helicase [Spiroplasma helicoides]|uniref:Replicative DNA helicase n=1 Tax=Spiroplasma helicoides TaxID=216938 RepID=A0A1B3SJ80_9MOLU|nr:replicative DNA helicase [Spiroplasma helicoides]AOG59980.1 replicative DNA helicase [Spiroplasma helicoides]